MPPVQEPRRELWEILVPTVRNDGRPIRTRFHRVWDQKIREIAGGLTIMPVAKGQWVSGDGALFKERMIPVRISCQPEHVARIIDVTLKHYDDQIAVMCYRISEDVRITYRKTP